MHGGSSSRGSDLSQLDGRSRCALPLSWSDSVQGDQGQADDGEDRTREAVEPQQSLGDAEPAEGGADGVGEVECTDVDRQREGRGLLGVAQHEGLQRGDGRRREQYETAVRAGTRVRLPCFNSTVTVRERERNVAGAL